MKKNENKLITNLISTCLFKKQRIECDKNKEKNVILNRKLMKNQQHSNANFDVFLRKKIKCNFET